MNNRNRFLVGLVATVTWTGLILQASVSFPGMLAKGLTLTDAFIRFFSYFTTLTNTFIAVNATICLVKPEGRWSRSPLRSSVETCLAVSIFFVTAGFTILLRNWVHFTGTGLLADNILHYAVTAVFLLYWSAFPSRQRLPWIHSLWWLLYPLLYFVYVLVQGWRTGLYPYPFIDATRIGYSRTLTNGTVLLILFWLGGLVLIGLGRVLHRRALSTKLDTAEN